VITIANRPSDARLDHIRLARAGLDEK